MPRRLTSAEVLGHPLRQRLYAALKDTPGTRLADLAFLAQASRNTVEYHLEQLRRHGLVETRHADGEPWMRWFVRNDKRPASRLRPIGPSRRLYEHLVATGAATVTALGEALSMHPSHVMYWLRKLERAGILATSRRGRTRVAYVAGPAGTAPEPPASPASEPGPPEWSAEWLRPVQAAKPPGPAATDQPLDA